MMSSIKELCECGKIAVYCYMPGFSNGDNPHFCDDCVRRGCDCNHVYIDRDAYHPALNKSILPEGEEGVDWIWIEKNVVWTDIDSKGRQYPCGEYDYDSEGWEREFNPHIDETNN